MSIIETIVQKLSKYPDVKYKIEGNWLTVLPVSDEGFMVALFAEDGEYMVCYESWHEHFDNEEDALNCFAFGLSNDCRLKEYKRGDLAYKWTVEYRENGEWIADGTTSRVFFPFWRRRRIRYLKNNIVGSL